MSAYTGPQGKGAAAARRQVKHAEADARNKATPIERRRAYRRPCPLGKRQLADAHAAQTELVGAVIAKNLGHARRRECRTYQCNRCGWHHLTSQPLKPKRGAA